jgi:Sodium/hydrogen exchanger family
MLLAPETTGSRSGLLSAFVDVSRVWLHAQAVPAVLKWVPGGSAILGFLIAGAAIGPYGLGLIVDTGPVKHLAEIGVIFLLFNLGLELSLERLIALARQVRAPSRQPAKLPNYLIA